MKNPLMLYVTWHVPNGSYDEVHPATEPMLAACDDVDGTKWVGGGTGFEEDGLTVDQDFEVDSMQQAALLLLALVPLVPEGWSLQRVLLKSDEDEAVTHTDGAMERGRA